MLWDWMNWRVGARRSKQPHKRAEGADVVAAAPAQAEGRSMDAPGGHIVAISAVVRGQVQGVGFRYRTMWAAQEEDLSGWVRNEDDGSVQLHVEGPPHRVEQFMNTLRRGFPGVRASRIETSKVKAEGFKEFRVI